MKKWYLSKTMWVNIIATIALILQTVTGNDVLSPEVQGVILGLLNIILRIITKHGLQL